MTCPEPRTIRALEELSFRTWPPRETGRIGNWDIGASDGFTRRANSAQPLGDPGLEFEEAICRVVAWHSGRGIAPCLKISQASPDGLDALLAAKGWSLRTPAAVMTLDLTGSVIKESRRIRVEAAPSQEWLSLSAVWEGRSSCSVSHHAALLSRLSSAGIVTLEDSGGPCALGVGVLDGEDAFLYDLVVDSARRGKGIGRELTCGMLAWAASRGATRAVLQVLDANEVARGLYESLGFVAHHGYHYRQAPGSCGTEGC